MPLVRAGFSKGAPRFPTHSTWKSEVATGCLWQCLPANILLDIARNSSIKVATKAVQLSHCPYSQSPCSEKSCHCSVLLSVVQSHFWKKDKTDKKLKWLCAVTTRDCLFVYVPSIFVCGMRVLCLHRKKGPLCSFSSPSCSNVGLDYRLQFWGLFRNLWRWKV